VRSRGTDVNLQYAAQHQEYVAIADRVAADHPQAVLDWGCGWGQMSALLRERGVDMTLLDYVGPGAADAEVPLELYPDLARYESSEAVRLPYEDGRFDAVLSCGVLEHVAEPEASLDELRRVLRPGGMLYVYKLPNRFSYLEAIARHVDGMYYHGKEPFDTIYTLRSAREIVTRHGFEVLEAREANMLPLTAGGAFADRHGQRIFAASAALARVPGLRRLATNVEVVARAAG
jgi:ubiquinone/menaquinone biosynthesis C-methylase UbiE